MGACCAGMGRVAVVDALDGDGSGALPRDDEPPLDPLGIIIRNIVVKTKVPQPNLYLFFENIRKILCRSEKIVHKVIKAIPVIIIHKIA